MMLGESLLYATVTSKMDVFSILYPIIVVGLVLLTRRVDVDMAKLINTVVAFLFDGKSVKDFHIDTIQFFPFVLRGFKVTILETKGNPEATIEIGQLKVILTDPLKILKNIIACTLDFNFFREYILHGGGDMKKSRVKWVRIRYTDFKVSCKNLTFDDVLKSSDRKSDKPTCVYSRKLCDRWDISLVQTVLSVLELSFHNMSFDFKMPLHNCEIVGGTAYMHIYFCRHRSKFPSGVVGIIDMANSKLAINHGADLAFAFVNLTTNIIADLYLPSGFHEVSINCHDGNKVIMNIQPFLAFYEKEMAVDDDMIELKLATGAETNGKMCTVAVAFAAMNMLMFDSRKTERGSGAVGVGEINDLDSSEISVYGMAAMIKRYFYGSDGLIVNTYTTDVMSTGMKCDSWKEIGAKVERVEWINTNHAVDEKMFMEKISAIIVKKNVTSNSSHVDIMSMHANIDNFFFNRVSQTNLEWLFVLQNLSDNLPESRFAQPKVKNLCIFFEHFYFSVCPDEIVNWTMTDTLNPPSLDAQHDRAVSFLLRDFSVAAYSDACDISLYRISIGESVFDVKIPWKALRDEYGLSAASDFIIGQVAAGEMVTGNLFSFKDYRVQFSMGPDEMLFDSFWGPSGVQIDFYSYLLGGGIRKVSNFVKSSDLCILWNKGQDMSVKMCDCDVSSNMTTILFFQSCQRLLLGTIKKMTDHMKYVTEFPSLDGTEDVPEAPDTVTSVSIPKITIKVITSDPIGTVDLTLVFSSLNVSMSRFVSKFAWDSLRLSTNKCNPHRPFLVIKNGDACMQQEVDSGSDSYSRIELSFESIDVVVSTSAGVGTIIDSLQRDQKVFNEANSFFANRSKNIKTKSVNETDYSKMFIDINVFRIFFDGAHDSADFIITNFCTIEFTGLCANLDNSAQEDFVHRVIKTLDHIDTGLVFPYGQYSGGTLSMTVEGFAVYFSAFKAPILSLRKCAFDGPLYSCAIINLAQVVDREDLAIVDIHGNVSGVTISTSREPSKVYAGFSISIQHGFFFLPEVFSSLRESLLKIVSTATPQGKEDQRPLAWWDNLRFWTHGYLKFSIQKMDILQIASTVITDSLVVYTTIDEYAIYVDNKSIEMGGSSFGVFCRFSSDEDLSRVVDYSTLLNQFRDSVSGGVNDSQINKIIHIPDVKVICRHARDAESLLACGQQIHHDVCSLPDCYEKDDTYSSFRLKPLSTNWNVGILCGVASSGDDSNVSLNLRIDIIYRFCNVYLSNTNTSANKEKVVETKVETKVDIGDNSDDSDDDIDQSTIYKERDSSVTLGSLVRSVNFQMHTPNFVVHSWQSDDNYEGIVFIQDSMDIQFNLLNEVVDSSSSSTLDTGRASSDTAPPSTPLPSIPPREQRVLSTRKGGVTFSADLVRVADEEVKGRDSRTTNLPNPGPIPTPTVAGLPAGRTLKMKVHLFFMDIATAELFVRDWGIYEDTSVAGDEEGRVSREPQTVREIKGLFSKVCRIAHAQSVCVKHSREAEESDIVKREAFTFSGHSCSLVHRLREVIDEHSIHMQAIARRNKKDLKIREEWHSALAPPLAQSSRHAGARFSRIESHGLHVNLFNFLANHALLKPVVFKSAKELARISTKRTKDDVGDSSKTDTPSDEEIWSLKIIDVRLLWTLAIRDTLFRFVHKHLLTKEETFGKVGGDPSEKTPNPNPEKEADPGLPGVADAGSKPSRVLVNSNKGKQKENAAPVQCTSIQDLDRAKSSEAKAMLSRASAPSLSPAPDVVSGTPGLKEGQGGSKKGSLHASQTKIRDSGRRKGPAGRLAAPINSRKDKPEKYFKIELVDPQINFLDTKSLSSLILGFKSGLLEGKRNMFSLCYNKSDGRKHELCRKNDIRLQMAGVSAFTVPVEISDDGDVAVHWKDFDFAGSGSAHTTRKESSHLKLAIADFEIRAQYSFFLNVSAKTASKYPYKISDEDPVASFSLDLPVICLDIDSQQFYAILNVTKNLLLAPPPVLNNSATEEEVQLKNDDVDEILRDPELLERNDMKFSANKLDMNFQACRDEMKVYVEEVLKDFNSESDLVRCVELFIGKATWKLRDDLESHSVLEAGFVGVYAMFSSHKNKSSDTRLEIQRFWASDEYNLTLFDTAMVIDPELESEPCMRCGQSFTTASNSFDACKFHAYGASDVPLEFDATSTTWPCCGRSGEFAEPCEMRPHKCKELMFSIRAAVNPPARIEDIDISILTNLEVSIFPGASYSLNLRVSKQIADVIHRYFSLGNDPSSNTVTQAKSEMGADGSERAHAATPSSLSSSLATSTRVKNAVKEKVQKGIAFVRSASPQRAIGESDRLPESTSVVPSTPLSLGGSSSHFGVGDGDVAASAAKRAIMNVSKHHSQIHLDSEAAKADEGKKPSRQEGVYIKYLRIGDINIELNTKGFPINLDRNRAVVDPFTCKGVVVDWNTLIRNVEIHAALSVFNNAASSSFSRLNQLVFGSAAARAAAKGGVLNSVKGQEVASENATKRDKAAALLGIS